MNQAQNSFIVGSTGPDLQFLFVCLEHYFGFSSVAHSKTLLAIQHLVADRCPHQERRHDQPHDDHEACHTRQDDHVRVETSIDVKLSCETWIFSLAAASSSTEQDRKVRQVSCRAAQQTR